MIRCDWGDSRHVVIKSPHKRKQELILHRNHTHSSEISGDKTIDLHLTIISMQYMYRHSPPVLMLYRSPSSSAAWLLTRQWSVGKVEKVTSALLLSPSSIIFSCWCHSWSWLSGNTRFSSTSVHLTKKNMKHKIKHTGTGDGLAMLPCFIGHFSILGQHINIVQQKGSLQNKFNKTNPYAWIPVASSI